MARLIVFPSRNNITYRSGFIRLTAIGSEFMQADIEGNTAAVVDKLKNTARQASPEFEGEGIEYLRNAVENMYTERKKMSGEVKFIGILPLPLGVKDSMEVNWTSSPSNFIEGAYGKVKGAGVGQASTFAAAESILNTGGNWASKYYAPAAGLGTGVVDGVTSHGVGTGQNLMVEQIVNGNHALSQSIAASPAAQAYLKPGHGTKQILGMQSDASIMQFHNEAAALNGVRQIIFDPGYWQSFQGVTPRGFTLTWDIIPENHEDAINGLEFCSRVREYSLPQSVSGVELLSPCYWQVDWSNEYLDSQTLYSNLVIKNIEVDYAQQGEWHGASTPKMFRISIQFEEAKAPTADIYKFGDNFIPVSVATRGASRGGGGNRGGRGGSGGYDGPTGTHGNPFPNTGGGVNIPGTNIPIPIPTPGGNNGGGIWDIITGGGGGILDKIKTQIGKVFGPIIDNLIKVFGDKVGDKIDDMLGGFGGNIGQAIGDWVNGAIDEATTKAGKVIKDAIESGDFKDLDDKLKDAVFSSQGLSDKVGEAIGGAVGKKLEDLFGLDIDEDVFADILADIANGNLDSGAAMDAIKKKVEEKIGEAVYGVFGNLELPDIVDIINKGKVIFKNPPPP